MKSDQRMIARIIHISDVISLPDVRITARRMREREREMKNKRNTFYERDKREKLTVKVLTTRFILRIFSSFLSPR